jgi:prepilin-type N-terminal cleavage/methylation domain-containing protein
MKRNFMKGFTLVELLLVMVIFSIITVMSVGYVSRKADDMRIDRTVLQAQYILNSALAYYVANGQWPDAANQIRLLASGSISSLQTAGFLPATPILSPYVGIAVGVLGSTGAYAVAHYTTAQYSGQLPAGAFAVMIPVGLTTKQAATGKIIAGRLPMAFYMAQGFVVAYVNIPGQNLNNASAINFAGLYHHGACVPVPTCPSSTAGGGTTTTPQIFVMPVSVSGVNDPASSNVYPISSFTAYSTAMAATPDACTDSNVVAVTPCTPIDGNPPASGQYWRVCLQIVTERGNVQYTRSDAWGNLVTLGAFTRCSISNEPAGSTFSVYSN